MDLSEWALCLTYIHLSLSTKFLWDKHIIIAILDKSKLIQRDLNTLAKITQLVSGRAKSEIQVYLTPALHCFGQCHLLTFWKYFVSTQRIFSTMLGGMFSLPECCFSSIA